ncbi:MAG TPA: ABC transporter permease [Pilimelia sp.]|nr:ABC transporter permease [Pilimelia sp.]
MAHGDRYDDDPYAGTRPYVEPPHPADRPYTAPPYEPDPAPAAYARLADDREPDAAPPPGGTVPPEVLDRVFDDPEQGESGRDRLRVHIAWEGGLFVAAAIAAALLHRRDPAAFTDLGRSAFPLMFAALCALGLAAELSLRAGAVNLAVGPAALLGGLFLADRADEGLAAAVGLALGAGLAAGLVLALLVVGLHVPAWAATLGGACGIGAALEMWRRDPPAVLAEVTDRAPVAAAAVAGTALLVGLLGAVQPVRRLVGRFRPVRDPAARRGFVGAVVVVVGLSLSTAVAVAGGVLLVGAGRQNEADVGFGWTGLGVGVALLGGVSAFGRRGGVAGTVLAALLLAVTGTLLADRPYGGTYALAGAAILVGLVGTRVVERFGAPAGAAAAAATPAPSPEAARESWFRRLSRD